MNENNDLDKTVQVDNLTDLINTETESPIVVTESREEQNDEMYKALEEEKLTKMDKLKRWWQNLNKKNKILLITLVVVMLLFIGVLTVYLIIKDDDPSDNNETKEKGDTQDSIVIAEDNYIYEDGVLTLLSSTGKEVGTYDCVNKSEKLCYVAFSSDEDNFDIVSNVYENGQPITIRSRIFENNYVFIFDNAEGEDTITLYDIQNKSTIDKFKLVKDFSYEDKSYAIVENLNKQYGLYEIGSKAQVRIDFNYDYLGYISGKNSLVFKKNDTYGLVDLTGKELVKGITGEIKNYNDEYIVTQEYRSYKLLNSSGKVLVDKQDDFITLEDDYLAYVNNNRLYLMNYDLVKYYEEGIKLYSNDYVGQKVYNAEGNKVEEKISFKLSKDGNTIKVEVINDQESDEIEVDIRDSKLSEKLSYYSYYGGKLYFYEDEAKTKLLGTYACNNLNDLTKDNVSTCKVASDTVYEDNYSYSGQRNAVIPIINNRFVFIDDSPLLSSGSTKVINLYNLSTSKIMSTYRSVNSHTSDNNGELSHVTSADFRVMAENTSGKYGMISISLTNATGVYAFKYDAMEQISTSAVAVKEGSTWSILDNKGNQEGNYPGKIMGMVNDYVIIQSGNKVKLYKRGGSSVVDEEFEFINVGSKFFGGVKSGKVYVYSLYTGESAGNQEGYQLNSSDYFDSPKPVFKFSTANGLEWLDILQTDGNYSTYSLAVESEDGDE